MQRTRDRRSAGRWPRPGDVAVAAVFALVGVLVTAGLVEGAEVWPAAALTVVHSAALAWRRHHPEAVLAVMAATAGVGVAAGWPVVMFGPAVVAAVHALGAARDPDRAVPVLAVTVAVMAAAVLAGDATADTVVGNAAVLAVAWWLGDRQRRAHVAAERAEREAGDRAARAVADERLRIARELHDVVAHALSVIAVQAGTGRVVLDRDPETARAALASIEGESRAALADMRRLVDVLRADDDGGGELLAPSPGLADLGDLVAATVRSGLPVEVRVDGTPAPLPAGAELAVYRIVQEALTNVRRHAAATRAEVSVRWGGDGVDVEVLDDGRGPSGAAGGAGTGHGLVGMRERAALYGGTFEAGPRPGDGFRVAVHLPFGGPS